jgi:hypothetical protein
MTSAPGWTATVPEMKDRRMMMMEDSNRSTPEGKKWECCTACNGRGKVLVDDIPEVKRYPHPASLEPFILHDVFFWVGLWQVGIDG